MTHYYRDAEMLGTRRVSDRRTGQAMCPAGYKYLTCLNMCVEKAHLALIATPGQYDGGAFNGVGNGISGGTGADADIFSGTITPSVVMPFKLVNQKFHCVLRNNGVNTVTATLYDISPRNIVPTTRNDTGTTASSICGDFMRCVQEGIADIASTAVIETSNACNYHVSAPDTGAQSESIMGLQLPELSLHPPFTIFDSSVFTKNYKVNQTNVIRMKPGDEIVWNVKMPNQMFPDGTQAYTSADFLGFDFSRLQVVQLVGHLGHISSVADTPCYPELTTVGTLAGTLTGKKQGIQIVSTSTGVVDYEVTYEFECEIYNTALSDPMHAVSYSASTDGNNMNDSFKQQQRDYELN